MQVPTSPTTSHFATAVKASTLAPHAPTTVDDLLAPFIHVCSGSSKNIRGLLVEAFNGWVGLHPDLAAAVKTIVDMLHNSSLLVDDIEDGSELRRGAPAAHCVFGMPLTLNCANQVYFMALQKVLELPALAAATAQDEVTRAHYAGAIAEHSMVLSRIFTEEMIELHEGQGMDIFWRDTLRCPTMAEYDIMVMKKTGGLFRLALRVMVALAPPSNEITEERSALLLRLVENIGVFFQTLDDYLNVCSADYHSSKTFCEDLTEGKFSYPIIHSIQKAEGAGDRRLLSILKQKPTDDNVKRFCVGLMENTGSLDATRQRVDQLKADVYETLGSLGGSRHIDACMAKMCKLMAVRA